MHATKKRVGCLFSALIMAGLGSGAQAQSNVWQGGVSTDWFDSDNWSLNVVPGAGAAVAMPSGTTRAPTVTNDTAVLSVLTLNSGQTLTVEGWASAIAAEEMTIGGTIRHASNTVTSTNSLGEWVPDQRIWLKGSNITILATGKLDGDYRGYPRYAGPGSPPTPGDTQGGVSHAGPGRRGQTAFVVAAAYGDPAAPFQPGSGGSNTASGAGGGSIRIEATGNLTVHGPILARGQNSPGTYGQTGGSGGSVWLTCRTLAGSTSGWVAVDGGSGNQAGAGASAGRIAVLYDSTDQSALGEPCPPIRFSGKPGARGSLSDWLEPAMGTLYFPDTTMLSGPFAGKRLSYTKLVIPGFTNWTPGSLTLDDCVVGLPEGMRLEVAGNLVLTNSSALYVFSAEVDDPVSSNGAWVGVGGDFYVGTNCWVCPYASPTNGGVSAFGVTGDLVIAQGGGFNADYKGYTFWHGPGSPLSQGGGGYGGVGSEGFGGAPFGLSYGEAAGPVLAGSGGGTNASYSKGTGQGGGAIRLAVGGKAKIDGTLTANGSGGFVTHGPAGSGGGIEVRCHTFEGSTSGLIRAQGGYGNYYGGSGGGGRIVVSYNAAAQAALPNPQTPVRFSTYAYLKSTQATFNDPAEMGTLYLSDPILLAASTTSAAVWEGQRFWHTRLVIPNFTNWTPASLTVSNCVVRFQEGFRLAPTGDVALWNGAELQLVAAETNGMAPYGARLEVAGNLVIGTNSWIIAQAHPFNGAVVLLRVAGNMRTDAGGGVNADGRGYKPITGNTNGPGPGRNSYAGGGHGGKGGNTLGGYTNGLAELPLGPGSPGGMFNWVGLPGTSGAGGGAIRLLVGGQLTMDGTLTANGLTGDYYGGPGGSGGSIFVAAGQITGAGLLSARGGNAHSASGTGGGGRIAVWWRTSLAEAETRLATVSSKGMELQSAPGFAGTMQVQAGPTGGHIGDPGTAGFYRCGLPGVLMLIR